MTIDIFILLLQGAMILALLRIDRKISKLGEIEQLLGLSNKLKDATDSLQSALQNQKKTK